jgi:predicted amidohydrolase
VKAPDLSEPTPDAATRSPKAHLVQLDIAWEEPQENYERVRQLLDRAELNPGDLVLLPEMFDTGFSFNIQKTNDKGGSTLAFFVELASEFHVLVQGGRTVAACHRCAASNLMSVVAPTGNTATDPTLVCEYTKVHPFSIGKENEAFEGGDEVLTYTWSSPAGSIKVCPAICYDLRFPELFRLGLLQGAELFALGACWPSARQHHWRALAIARAIENQAYMLAVNRTGKDPSLEYVGGSIAIGPRGDVLGELGPEPGVLSVPIDVAEPRRWREKFPAWRDIKLFKAPAPQPSPAPQAPAT